MGIGDRLSDMGDDAVRKQGGAEKAKGNLGKAADAGDRATGGKYQEQVDKAEAGAKSGIDKLNNKKNKRK